MRRLIATALVLVAAVLPASARSWRHHGVVHRHESQQAGMPITAEPDSIRINSVGQVISQPVPVIEKERKIDDRIQRELQKPAYQDVPGKPPLQQP